MKSNFVDSSCSQQMKTHQKMEDHADIIVTIIFYLMAMIRSNLKGPFTSMCSSRKYPYCPPQQELDFLAGGGLYETKKIKGWGCELEKIPSVGEVWKFSGAIQYRYVVLLVFLYEEAHR